MEKSRVQNRKFLCLFLCMAMMLLTPLSAGAVTVDAAYQDGDYQGTGRGRNGDITVSVTIADGRIIGVADVSNNETPRYWEQAVRLFDTVAEKNGTDGVDTVTGATLSSRGILAAVQDAVSKAAPSTEPDEPVWEPEEIDQAIFASGSGTQEDPYSIQSVEQMKAFADSLNSHIDYFGKYVRLDADLDLSGENWTPVGGSFYRFDGEFDGNGRTITGLTEGSAKSPLELDGNSAYIGLFGWLNEHAVVKDLTLEQVAIYTQSPGSAYLGGIAGRMSGSETEGDYRGTRIDGCSVRGTIHHTTVAGTTFVGGICGHVFKGSIINTMTDMNLSCFEKSGELAEVGGIAGLLNRGLVANCYALGDITGSGCRDTQYDIEGMACIGNIAAVDGGCIVNCYGEGNVEALEYSIDTGIIAGWVTGIGKAYHCWYNEAAKMTIDGRSVSPVDPFGEVVPGGISDEYFFRFPGALTAKVDGYRAGSGAEAEKLAKNLNASFSAFPVDIEGLYGLSGTSLKNWTVAENHAVFGDEKMEVTYVQPEVEKAVQEEETAALKDGTWYGRSEDKSTIVRITVQDGAVVDTEAETGQTSGDNYEQAEARARFKALYGDTTDYAPADLSIFKGLGTESSPYQIENEAQLRYLASSVNEDTDWDDTWFLQTKDITVSDADWKPIGWGIFADADNDGFGQDVVALYPFRGHFDGGDHSISGLKAGSAETPVRGHYMGLFGIIQGEYTGNEIPQDAAVAELKNIHLENVEFYTENRWRSYIGGLVGNAQGGFSISHCSVDGGTISSRSTEDFAFAGGLAGSLMYGCIADSWTDVELTAYSGKNYSYAGGMAATTNRATIINSYSLSNVHADADQTNRAEAGGFTGLDGGVCINCYAGGNVESFSKYSMYVGGFSGMAAASSEHRLCYFNHDAEQKIAGSPLTGDEKKYAGKFVNESPEAASQAQTASAMVSQEFVDLLNHNRAGLSATLAEIRETLGADERGSSRYESLYYNGDGSDLKEWVLEEGKAVFNEEKTAPDSGGSSGGGDSSSSGGGGAAAMPSYRVTVPSDAANGRVSVDLSRAKENQQVTITVEPEEGCQTDQVVVKDRDGNEIEVKDHGDGTWTFTMPSSDVMIEPSFVKKETGEPEADPPVEENCPSEPFKDVDTSLWYHEGIDYVIEHGMMKGVADNLFAPEETTIRAMIVTILYRLEGEPASEAASFRDVDGDSWYEAAVNWAAANGIVNGYDADTFAPMEPITREQMAAILCRYADFKGRDVSGRADLGRFTDRSAVSDWAQAPMAWAVNAALINGMTDTTLVPQGSATRAQAATLMMRLCENVLK